MTTPPTQQRRNPMGLEELQAVHRDVTSTLEQIKAAIDVLQDEPNQQRLLVTLYTKAMMVKLQVQVDMEKLK